MVSWASKRKFKYISIFVIIIVFILGGFFLVNTIGKEQSCFDKKQILKKTPTRHKRKIKRKVIIKNPKAKYDRKRGGFVLEF